MKSILTRHKSMAPKKPKNSTCFNVWMYTKRDCGKNYWGFM